MFSTIFKMIPRKQINIFLHTYLCEGRGDKKGKTVTIYRLKNCFK